MAGVPGDDYDLIAAREQISETVGERWLRVHAHELNYDPRELPDCGDERHGETVVLVDRGRGAYETLPHGAQLYQVDKRTRHTLPRIGK
jgi:hypothetical protein